MKNVAIVGTQGVPAQYGGFETLAEQLIGEHHSEDVQYTVFCSSKNYKKQSKFYKGAKLKYVPIDANGAQSILYDIVSMIRVMRGFDVVLILGVSGCMFLPIFRLFFRKKLIINIDGLEHQRDKWGQFSKWFLKQSEAMAVKYADVTIADNKGIADYVSEIYNKSSRLIAYGGDHALRIVSDEDEELILSKYGLVKNEYALSICRIEPENNCHLLIEAFAESTTHLVFIGNWERNEYSRSLKERSEQWANIQTISGIYDLDELYVIRKNCKLYLHGHSAGGTNPSLVEAMFFSKLILAFDVIYNRETTENKALYFRSSLDLNQLIHTIENGSLIGAEMKEIADRRYRWKSVIREYEDCY